MWLGSHGNDCGSSTIRSTRFAKREDPFDMYGRCGVGCAYASPTSALAASTDLPDSTPQTVRYKRQGDGGDEHQPPGSLLDHRRLPPSAFQPYLAEYHTLLTDNRIWKQRAPWVLAGQPGVRSLV
jgi:NADH-quinone oxidoreductase subunit D